MVDVELESLSDRAVKEFGKSKAAAAAAASQHYAALLLLPSHRCTGTRIKHFWPGSSWQIVQINGLLLLLLLAAAAVRRSTEESRPGIRITSWRMFQTPLIVVAAQQQQRPRPRRQLNCLAFRIVFRQLSHSKGRRTELQSFLFSVVVPVSASAAAAAALLRVYCLLCCDAQLLRDWDESTKTTMGCLEQRTGGRNE